MTPYITLRNTEKYTKFFLRHKCCSNLLEKTERRLTHNWTHCADGPAPRKRSQDPQWPANSITPGCLTRCYERCQFLRSAGNTLTCFLQISLRMPEAPAVSSSSLPARHSSLRSALWLKYVRKKFSQTQIPFPLSPPKQSPATVTHTHTHTHKPLPATLTHETASCGTDC